MRDVTTLLELDEQDWDEFILYMPKRMADAYKLSPITNRNASEDFLNSAVRPDEHLKVMKMHFWDKLERAVVDKQQMSDFDVYGGIIPRDMYDQIVDQKSLVVCWLCKRPISYEARLRIILEGGVEKMKDIMNLPLRDEDGNVNLKAANLVMNAFKLLDLRTHGAYLQRIEEKSFQVHSTAKEERERVEANASIEEIDRKILELESKYKKVTKSEAIEYAEAEVIKDE